MVVSMRTKAPVSGCVARAAPRVSVVCKAQGEGASVMIKAQIAAATLAAAALIAQPVHAGVVLQQPELKKVFQSDAEPAPVKERPFRLPGASPAAPAPAAAKPAEAKKDEAPTPDIIDPRAIALPASVAVIAGLGLAASKVDDGFSEWISESGALVRKSDNWAGFEEDIKGAEGSAAPAVIGGRKGTIKAKAGTKSGTKSGTIISSIFGTKSTK